LFHLINGKYGAERIMRNIFSSILAAMILLASHVTYGQYNPHTTYYNSATGTGSTLMTQLRTIVSSMTGVNYGNARFSAPITDVDPNNDNNVLLIYNRASVSSAWDSGATWNREHIWPVSRLGVGDPSNTTTNLATDQFNLRPCNPSINSSRSNKPFGMDTTTGTHGHQGSYYYPGDADAGDVARAQFYMSTRYSQLTLTDGSPAGTQMGDLSSLVNYHYRDVPDNFERRRNHAIYGLAGENSPAISNTYKQSNRNPYVDRPEYVWSVFVDQQNDSQLYVGGSPAADGSSTNNLNFGSVLVGAPLPGPQNVTLTKNGLDGTYYEVTTSGLATSSVTGRYNAFPVITSGTSSRVLSVGLNTNTTTAGLRTGSVTINNLDITTAGGSGRGANDGNDTINTSLSVLDHANPSFSLAGDVNSLVYDFGTVALSSPPPTFSFDIANLMGTSGFTARLELDSISGSGSTSVLSTNLIPLTGGSALSAGTTTSFLASMSTLNEGSFSATYTVSFSDENLSGAMNLGSLALTLTGIVESATNQAGDFDGDGDVDGRDLLGWQRNPSIGELSDWQANYGFSSVVAISTAVPEPNAWTLTATAFLGITASVRTFRVSVVKSLPRPDFLRDLDTQLCDNARADACVCTP
jgi:endonuclease I